LWVVVVWLYAVLGDTLNEIGRAGEEQLPLSSKQLTFVGVDACGKMENIKFHHGHERKRCGQVNKHG